MKDDAGVGVEVRQIYLPGRRSHLTNGSPCQKLSNPNYHAKKGSPSLLPPEQQAEGEGPSSSTDGLRRRRLGQGNRRLARRP